MRLNPELPGRPAPDIPAPLSLISRTIASTVRLKLTAIMPERFPGNA